MAISKMLDLLAGLIVLAGGVLPILAMLGVIGELPVVPELVLMILILIGGLLLLLTGFSGTNGNVQKMKKKHNLIVGALVFISGLVLLLGTVGIISVIPAVPAIVLYVILILGGFVLFLDGLVGATNYNS